jgi:outer membrane protein OmpA-like peptidoglycan-associated protein
MKRIETDESEHAAADGSDLRSTNPWLASYGRYAVRATRLSTPPAPSTLNLRLWAGAGAAVLLVLGIGATQYVAAAGSRASADDYPLEQNGGIAVASAQLDDYLAALEARATARRFLMTFDDLLFGDGSTQLGDREQGELVRMADFLRAHPETIAQIVGHADDRGDAAANSRLAGQRAVVVRSYLVVQGVDQSRLTAVSAEEQPLLDNRTQAGRAANRRVQILVQKSPMEPSR